MAISRERRAIVAVVGVALLSSIFGFANAFAHDDRALIPHDARLQDLTQVGAILSNPYWPPPYLPDQYRPVTSLLLTLQYIVGSGDTWPFRLMSYVLYAGVCVAFLRMALLLMPAGAAIAGALLFAAHPVHVEATALAVGQAELVVAVAILTATTLYARMRLNGRPPAGHQWILIALLYVLAMFSKEHGFLLPGFLLLTELLLVRGEKRRTRRDLLWLGYASLTLIAFGGLAARAVVLGDLAVQPNIAEALVNKTLAGRAVTMFQIFPHWLRLLVWPSHLRIDYSPREFVGSASIGAPEVFGFVLFAVVVIAAVRLRHRIPVATFGLAWTAVALFPVSNVFIPTGVMIAERTLFLASAGVVLTLTTLTASLLERAARTRHALQAAVAVLVGLGVIRSAVRQRDWRDNDALTLSAIRDSPRSWRAQANYGEYLFDRGRAAEGRLAFERAIALAPRPWSTRNAYARRLREIRDDSAALEQLRRSLSEFPTQVEAVPDLVAAMLAVGRYSEARDIAHRAVVMSGAPPVMARLRELADSAMTVAAPAGSIRVFVPTSSNGPMARPAFVGSPP